MQNAEELFYESIQLGLRAERAVGEAKAGLQRMHFDILCRVLEVDPHDTDAQFNLGNMYRKGDGVEKDTVKAVHLYRKAAAHEDADAQCNLGVVYENSEDENNEGVEKDAAQAVHWYRQAAVQGQALAQCRLGSMYVRGEGVEKDAVQAAH
jgi:TPR repeat protein